MPSNRKDPVTFLSLPPDLISRVLSMLPLPCLATSATVSRRFKILAYNDIVYIDKLQALGVSSEALRSQVDKQGKDDDIDTITNQMKMLPGGHLLPGSAKYWETGSMFGGNSSVPGSPGKEPIEGESSKTQNDDEASKEHHLNGDADKEEEAFHEEKPAEESSKTKKLNLVIGAGGLKAAMKAAKAGMDSPKMSMRFASKQKSAYLAPYSSSNKDEKGYSPMPSSRKPLRELFKGIMSDLRVYYFDFRKRQKDSRLFKDFSKTTDIATILHRLQLLHYARFFEEVEEIEHNINSTIEWFEALVLGQFERGYDTKNLMEMREAAVSLYNLNGGQACVQLFIAKHPIFFDQRLNPTLNPANMPLKEDPPSGFKLANDFASFMDNTIELCKNEINVLTQVFVPGMDTMTHFANRVFEDSIAEYLNTLLKVAKERETPKVYLHTLATAAYCCTQFFDFLNNNGKVDVNLKVMKVSMVELMKPYTEKYVALEIEVMMKRYHSELEKIRKAQQKEKKEMNKFLEDQETAMAHKRAVMQTVKNVLFAPVALTSSLASNTMKLFYGSTKKHEELPSSSVAGSEEELDEEETTTYRLDEGNMTSLLSLEFCLQLLNVNKDVLGRVLVVSYATEPTRIKSNVEKIFVQLIKTIGEQHIRPAFQTAIEKFAKSQPNDNYISTDAKQTTSVESLQFFELVHLADLVSQMMEVYYQEDIRAWIDENDFLTDLSTEKKAFERLLDDHVAIGMDKSVQVLINQVDYILLKEQLPSDYNPPPELSNKIFDLKPTRACELALRTLKHHMQMLTGATDKHTLEVFLGEIGVRMFNAIIKNIKRLQISQTGAMRLICDLNCYSEWAYQLRVGQVSKLFSALKEIGSLFIADGGMELRDLVHDQQRYQGTLRLDEVLELLASRTDFKKIQKYVESKECVIQ